MYGFCMFLLLHGGKVPTLRWVLLVMCTILILLCTVHIVVSVQQLLDAFVYAPAGVPDYSTTYWLNYNTTLRLIKNNLAGTLLVAQDFILIWRLYVVFSCNWKVVVFPIILAAGSVGSAYAASAMSVLPNHGLYGSKISECPIIVSAYVFAFALNLSVTGTIVARLWWVGRTTASLSDTTPKRLASSMYVVVESGAIFVVNNTVALALFASNSPAALCGLDVSMHVGILVSFVIVVQARLIDRYHIDGSDRSNTVPTARDETSSRAGVPQEQDTADDAVTASRPPTSVHGSRV
ncbi:hypothetical protein OG21DRAFT_152274 [Imleria badia]|nr:hypothetical protein OG21DRAFT_152274 [Imleria badia]